MNKITRWITYHVDDMDAVLAENTQAMRLLEHLDRITLANAFRGEPVPQDPGDEPTSVRLERVPAARSAEPTTSRGRRRQAIEGGSGATKLSTAETS